MEKSVGVFFFPMFVMSIIQNIMTTEQDLLTQLLAITTEVGISLAALGSAKVYGGTAAHTGLRLRTILVRAEGCVFASLVASDDQGNTLSLSDFYKGTPAPVAAGGDYLRVPPNYYFTAFTLTSGSVCAA